MRRRLIVRARFGLKGVEGKTYLMNGTERAQAEAATCRRRKCICARWGAFRPVPRRVSDARKFASMAIHAVRRLGLVAAVRVATSIAAIEEVLSIAVKNISRGEAGSHLWVEVQ